MEAIIAALWAIGFLVVLLGGIPYVIWLGLTAWSRRWKKLAVQIAIPVAAISILVGISSAQGASERKAYLEGVFDAAVNLRDPLFSYDSPRSFNGDGYSFSAYELPKLVRSRFESADELLLTEFPKRPNYRSHWDSVPWRESPIASEFEEHLQFALSRLDSENRPELEAHYSAVREALDSEGTYYSLFLYDPTDRGRLSNIDLFIVDLKKNRLYSINHNT